MSNIQIGKTVQLKSGGPIMTVDREASSGNVVCVWFDGNDRKEGVFASETLELYEAY